MWGTSQGVAKGEGERRYGGREGEINCPNYFFLLLPPCLASLQSATSPRQSWSAWFRLDARLGVKANGDAGPE